VKSVSRSGPATPFGVVRFSSSPGVSSSRRAGLLNPRLFTGNPSGCTRIALIEHTETDSFASTDKNVGIETA